MMLTTAEWSAIRMSLLIGTAAVAVSLPPGIVLGWLLARKRFPGKLLAEIVVFLPLVVPPVVTGYVLLLLFGQQGPLGAAFKVWTGLEIVFTWRGMVMAGALVGFPLMVRAMRASFETVDPKLEEAGYTLGCSRLQVFATITLPLAWPGILAGTLLAFTRALGEFGATRMVALNADGTRTIALEVFQLAETPGADQAPILRLVLVSIGLSAVALALCELLARKWKAAAP